MSNDKYASLSNLRVVKQWIIEHFFKKDDVDEVNEQEYELIELKTINGQSLIGSGNIVIDVENDATVDFTTGTGQSFGSGRNYNTIDITSDRIFHFVVNNNSDNYLLIHNVGSSVVSVFVDAVTCNGTAISESNIRIPLEDMEVNIGGYIELSIIAINGIAVITASEKLV